MKLRVLYIEQYNNLYNLRVNFESGNGLTMLVGNNGSGKSNILECISGIFHDVYKSKQSRKIKSNYILEYTLDEKLCRIENKNGTLRCYSDGPVVREKFILNNIPNYVVGLYSGEEDKLWTQYYEPYYKAYIQRIKTNQHIERMRLMLINKYYWNIALLTLLMSRNETIEPFIRDELNIKSIEKIEMHFNIEKYATANDLLKTFIDRFNPDHLPKVEYNLTDLAHSIFDTVLRDENGDILLDEDGNIKTEDSGLTDAEVFRFLTQAHMPKNEKIISEITIFLTSDITVHSLSEGEKKLILVKTALEILSDEKTLLLMDEPDAHLHESRKPVLCEMMREYPNRQIVIATHSPIMAQLAKENELLMLENDNGQAVILSEEKIQKIKRLSGTTWDVIGQGLMLKSARPLIVFEGKTDVLYAKYALDVLKATNSKYQEIKVDFISGGGADNIQFFIQDLLSMISSSKKIIVFFDRDSEGKKGASAITGLSVDDERITKCADVTKDNMIVSFIPYRTGITSGDFLIEDYFLWEPTIKRLVDHEIASHHQPVKQLPNLSKQVKKQLEERHTEFSKEEYAGFTALLDKIHMLSREGSHD